MRRLFRRRAVIAGAVAALAVLAAGIGSAAVS